MSNEAYFIFNAMSKMPVHVQSYLTLVYRFEWTARNVQCHIAILLGKQSS